MSDNKEHITSSATYAKTLIALLLLTALNIFIATISHAKWVAGFIILIAVIQAGIALTWFMHLKWDTRFMRILVAGVFILFAVVIIITFLDYKFR